MRARADAEGGQLHIESIPGLGTVVTLTLLAVPMPPATAETVGVPQSSPVDLDFLRTVVVCDDHQYLRDAVKSVLSNLPRFHIVGEASDGATCLDRVKDFRPDVLILDLSMPGGGPHLATAAKILNPGMHIVVFSGRQDENVKKAMLEGGADQYIAKTGRLQPLVEALDRAVVAEQGLPATRPDAPVDREERRWSKDHPEGWPVALRQSPRAMITDQRSGSGVSVNPAV
jgi:DNA-binding NarL/FixJ family response regulator